MTYSPFLKRYKMAIPTVESLLLPLLQVYGGGNEATILEATDLLADRLNLSDEERSATHPSGMPVFADRVGWAKVYLKKANILKSTRRGYFRITERGVEVLASNPDRINSSYLRQYPEFEEFKYGKKPSKVKEEEENLPPTEEKPLDAIHNACDALNSQLRKELLDRIIVQPPTFFENLVVKLFVAMGYGGDAENAGRALGGSGDGGIDGVINQDVLGMDRIYVQAKRYAPDNTVGAAAIRDFAGALGIVKANKGIFVTTSSFTADAVDTATKLDKRIVLMDGEMLTSLMIQYGVGCREAEKISIMRLDGDFFPDKK